MKNNSNVVLVTGAGGGLGKAICRKFHDQDFIVVATDYVVDSLSDIAGREGYMVRAMNVTDGESIRNVVKEIENSFGRLDVVVSNAGILDFGPVTERDPDEIVHLFQVNTFGCLRVVQACLELMTKSQGRVVCITSESFRLRTPFQAYQATKFALEGLADTMRRELAYLGIHLATLRPGPIETQMTQHRQISNPVPHGLLANAFEKFAARVAANKHARSVGPEIVADVVFQAATDMRKKAHYVVNGMPGMKILNCLPKKTTDRLLMKMFS